MHLFILSVKNNSSLILYYIFDQFKVNFHFMKINIYISCKFLASCLVLSQTKLRKLDMYIYMELHITTCVSLFHHWTHCTFVHELRCCFQHSRWTRKSIVSVELVSMQMRYTHGLSNYHRRVTIIIPLATC